MSRYIAKAHESFVPASDSVRGASAEVGAPGQARKAVGVVRAALTRTTSQVLYNDPNYRLRNMRERITVASRNLATANQVPSSQSSRREMIRRWEARLANAQAEYSLLLDS